MPLQISPFQVRRSPLDPTPQPQKPVWGPPDMAEQLQKGIAGIGQAFKQQYDTSYTRELQRKSGQEWLDASKLAQPGGPYAPGGQQLPPGVSSPQELPQAGALKPQIAGMIGEAAKKYGLDPTYLSKLVQIESAGDPSARNAGSGAAGLFQFVPGTWKQYGQGDPLDPAANIDAGARFTLANRASLQAALGRDPTSGELYLAHQQGIGGATKLLTGDPNARVADVLGKNATSNLGGLSRDATVGQFVSRWTQPFGGVGSAPAPTVVKGPGGVSYAVAPGAGAAASSGQQAAGDQPTTVVAKPRKPIVGPRADASGRVQVASADPGFVPTAPAAQAQAAVNAGAAYQRPPPRPIGTGGSGDVFQSPDIQVRPIFQPGQKFGETATKNAQPFSGIVLHHTATPDLDSALKISRGDPNRGGVPYGYHFYIDRDGSVIQGAPLSARTNHTHAGAGYDNSNSIGISLVGNSKDATPQQIEAGTKLAQQLQSQLGIGADRIAGHGQIRGEKEADEGLPILAALRGGVPPAGSSPTSRNAPGAPGAALGPGGGPGGAPTMQQLQAALAQAPAGFQQAFNALASKAPGGAQGLLGMLGGMIGKMTGGGGAGGAPPPGGGSAPGPQGAPGGVPAGAPNTPGNPVPSQVNAGAPLFQAPVLGGQGSEAQGGAAPSQQPGPQQQGPGAALAAAAAAPGPLVMPQGPAAPPPEPVQPARPQQGQMVELMEQGAQQLSREMGIPIEEARRRMSEVVASQQGGPGGPQPGPQRVAAAQAPGIPQAGASYPGTMSDVSPTAPAPGQRTAGATVAEPPATGSVSVTNDIPTYRQAIMDGSLPRPIREYLGRANEGVELKNEKGENEDPDNQQVDLGRIVSDPNAPQEVRDWANAEIEKRKPPPDKPAVATPAPVVAPPKPAVVAPPAVATPAATAPQQQPIPQAAAAAATKIGLNPDALAQMSPAMMRSLGYAIQAGEPAMVGAIVNGINAMTARQTGAGDGGWSYHRDTKTGEEIRFNSKTGERQVITPGRQAGGANPNEDMILQPGDPRRDRYTTPNDPRPWRLTTDDKGNVKPEPVAQNPIQEEAGKIATSLESTETYKKFKSQYGSMNAMEAALAEGTSAGDFNATLEAFKVVDPGSTVTTNEQGGIKILGGAEGVLKGWKSRVDANGGFLTEDMRAELFNAALEQTRATWHAGAKNDVNAARRKGELLGRGDKDVVGIATNFHEDPVFERRNPGDFPDGGRPIDGRPRNPNSRAGSDQPGRSQSKPYVVKRTFKTRDEAHAYLDAVGDRNPGWYQVTIEGEGTLPPVHAGQEP